MNDGRFIVSCCYSESRPGYYANYANRLEKSLDEFGQGVGRHIWRESWPPNSPSHNALHYGFKWYAVEAAREQGHRYVMWLDAGSCAVASIEPLWARIEKEGVGLLVGEDILGRWISDQALEHFGATREHAMTLRLAGGCFVGIDFGNPKGVEFFRWWGELAKKTLLFMGAHTIQHKDAATMRSIMVRDGTDTEVISNDDRVQGHRSDEACFSLMMEKLGIPGMAYRDWIRVMKTY